MRPCIVEKRVVAVPTTDLLGTALLFFWDPALVSRMSLKTTKMQVLLSAKPKPLIRHHLLETSTRCQGMPSGGTKRTIRNSLLVALPSYFSRKLLNALKVLLL
jgi:hypothetical protein